MINIYSDESKAFNDSFQITTFLYGKPSHCEEFKNNINTLVDECKKKKLLQKNFKNFHAYNTLTDKKLQVYIELLKLLKDYLLNKKIELIVHVESKEKTANNSTYIKEMIVKKKGENGSVINQLFKDLDDDNFTVIVERIDQIYLYALYLNKFGGENEKLACFPDKSGNYINFKDKTFKIPSAKLGEIKEISYFEAIRRLANALINTFTKLEKFPKSNGQTLTVIEPQNNNDDYMIQVCDVVSNFLLNTLRAMVGNSSELSNKKSEIFKEIFNPDLKRVKASFQKIETPTNEEKVICINPEFRDVLSFSEADF